MKTNLTILTLLITFTSFGQTAIKKSSIDSGGAITTNGNLSMVYTLGEVAIQENTNGAIHISEGFLSPDIISTVGLDNYTQLAGVQVYPNPAIDFVTINFAETGNYNITVYDLLGKEIAAYQANNTDTKQLTFKQLPKAVYMLLITNEQNKKYTSYKIIKQ